MSSQGTDFDGNGSGREPRNDNGPPPWVNVHVLSETIFCRRAGLLAHELREDDDGQERDLDRPPRLDWLPDYDEELIYNALRERWDNFWRVSTYCLIWGLIGAAVYAVHRHVLELLFLLPVPWVAVWYWKQIRCIAELERRRRAAAQAAAPLRLEDLGRREQVVNWWALRRIGFSLSPPRTYRDEQLRLAGKPFLVLRYGSWCIPVVRKHRGKHELHSQNRGRVAAYCHLIEHNEPAEAPFGVFMFAGSYDVFIIPNSARNEEIFLDGLRQARRVITDAAEGTTPPAPTGNRCSDCPLGKPLVYWAGKTDGHLQRLGRRARLRPGVDRRDYHSICGDRYGWTPPHNKSYEKQLPE